MKVAKQNEGIIMVELLLKCPEKPDERFENEQRRKQLEEIQKLIEEKNRTLVVITRINRELPADKNKYRQKDYAEDLRMKELIRRVVGITSKLYVIGIGECC